MRLQLLRGGEQIGHYDTAFSMDTLTFSARIPSKDLHAGRYLIYVSEVFTFEVASMVQAMQLPTKQYPY